MKYLISFAVFMAFLAVVGMLIYLAFTYHVFAIVIAVLAIGAWCAALLTLGTLIVHDILYGEQS